jgi:hypothetical protein
MDGTLGVRAALGVMVRVIERYGSEWYCVSSGAAGAGSKGTAADDATTADATGQ